MDRMRIGAIILAAGQGTRMRSEKPKVLHEVCGRPMLAYVLDACRAAGIRDCLVVVGHAKEMVIDAFSQDPNIQWVEQAEQRGTGHAVLCCREQIDGRYDHVLILCGDGPLIRAETIRTLLERHVQEDAAATLATAVLEDATGYGRIVRDALGNLRGIVEHGDCTEEERRIREVNPSYYCFRVPPLLSALDQIRPNNVKNEYYLTDALSILIEGGQKALAVTAVPPEDIFSINSRKDLARVNQVMRERVHERLMNSGVTIVDPATTWIDARATIGLDTVIHPFVSIHGPVKIGRNCVVGPFAHVVGGTTIADQSVVAPFSGSSG